jgi:glutathione synthase/RimK-type ligase-like ATP-grasp enzyme
VSTEIAIATCDALPASEPDDGLLIQALAAAGLSARPVSWEDPSVDWTGFAATIIRSTWNYTRRRAEFLAWADGVPNLFNPAAVVHANSDKRYLAALAERGVPTVPTEFFAPDEDVKLPSDVEFVVKPSVGAGSKGAGRFTLEQHPQAMAHAAELQAAGRTVMVQPYLSEVDSAGESALIFIDGRYSHAICKSALLPPGARHPVASEGFYVAETITPRQPSAAELALARDVVAGLGTEPLLYSRVDLLPSSSGPVLIELELIEPSLFLSYEAGAAARLAEAIAARVR